MTREILFKAKRLDNGEWVEGYLVKCPSAIQIGDCSPWYLQVPPVDPDDSGGQYNVAPSTVCEYTGLTDSDGKRVFDGDILKFHDEPNDYEWIGRVEFGNPNGSYTWGWQLVHISGPEPNIDTLCWFDMEEVGVYSEVIGNKFDGGKDDS